MIFIVTNESSSSMKIVFNNLRHRTVRKWYYIPLTHWGRDKMDAISQTIFSIFCLLNENIWIPIKISLKFVPKGPINNIPALVQIMAWCRPGDKPLSESMMVSLPTHICVTRPQWVKNKAQTMNKFIWTCWWISLHWWGPGRDYA